MYPDLSVTILGIPHTIQVNGGYRLDCDVYEMQIIIRNDITSRSWVSQKGITRDTITRTHNAGQFIKLELTRMFNELKSFIEPHVIKEYIRKENQAWKSQYVNPPFYYTKPSRKRLHGIITGITS